MGSIKKLLNPDPRLTTFMASNELFEDPFLVVDVRARGGFEGHWQHYGNQVRLIGFEPDDEECEALNSNTASDAEIYYPAALHRRRGTFQMYQTPHAASSGFYKTNMKFWDRFPDKVNLGTISAVDVDAVDFDSFARENDISSIDFLKLDVEGAELDVLHGAENVLRDSVWGLSVEIAFAPVHEDRPVFAEIDIFLRSLGFVLFDMTSNRHARTALSPLRYAEVPGATGSGQLIWGQAIYLRDAVAEIESGSRDGMEWSKSNVLKLASFMNPVNLNDCAFELLQFANQRGMLPDVNVDELLSHLVPAVSGNLTTYEEYLQILKTPPTPQVTEFDSPAVSSVKKVMPGSVKTLIRKSLEKTRDDLNKILEKTPKPSN